MKVLFSGWYLWNASFLDIRLEWVVSFHRYSSDMYLFFVSLVAPLSTNLFFEEKLRATSLLRIYGLMSSLSTWAFYCHSMATGGT